MLAVLLPMAARLDVLTGMDFGGAANHGDAIALTAHLDAQHTKAGLATMEGDALNQPDKRLALLSFVTQSGLNWITGLGRFEENL